MIELHDYKIPQADSQVLDPVGQADLVADHPKDLKDSVDHWAEDHQVEDLIKDSVHPVEDFPEDRKVDKGRALDKDFPEDKDLDLDRKVDQGTLAGDSRRAEKEHLKCRKHARKCRL